MDCSTPGFPVLHHFPELAQTHVHWLRDAIQPSFPLSSPSPAFNLSPYHGLLQWASSSKWVVKVFELQLQHRSFQWIFRVISFRIGWFDLLAVQQTLKSLLQSHNLKASILQYSVSFKAQLSHPYKDIEYRESGKRSYRGNWSRSYSLLCNTMSLAFTKWKRNPLEHFK